MRSNAAAATRRSSVCWAHMQHLRLAAIGVSVDAAGGRWIMKLAIFGATGGTGRPLLDRALAQDYDVTVLAGKRPSESKAEPWRE